MTTFTGVVHRDNWQRVPRHRAAAARSTPGFREEDFRRLKDAQQNALVQDLRTNNEEELGKERLQARIFAGTPYGHPVLGTVAGIDAITLDDVKDFVQSGLHARGADRRRRRRRARRSSMARARGASSAKLPAGPGAAARPRASPARTPTGIEVEIVEKETRATAISFGHPIAVTRSHPDFAALCRRARLARRAPLVDARTSTSASARCAA